MVDKFTLRCSSGGWRVPQGRGNQGRYPPFRRNQKPVHVLTKVPVRYHDDGSKKLNACIRFFLHMVYLEPKHKQCYLQITYKR
jgi:hypothetical protein